jgi:protein-disulfide isomerase
MSHRNKEQRERAAPQDWLLAAGALVFILIVGRYICVRRSEDYAASRQANPPVRVAVSARKVLGDHSTFLGSAHAPYTLVEFADYQCPPCRRANADLDALLKRFPQRVRLTYRNYPLDKIHPHAHQAAVFAEAARIQGHFWSAHDFLYSHQEKLSAAFFTDLTLRPGDNGIPFDPRHKKQAEENIEQDVDEGDALNIESTPSFFLCGPDGRVVRLGALSQVNDLIR